MNKISDNNKLELFCDEFSTLIGIERSLIHKDSKLSNLNWDSMALISTMALIDEIFSIVISGDQLTQCETFGDILALLKE